MVSITTGRSVMRALPAALAVLVSTVLSSQIFYMDLDDVLPMAGSVLIAEIVSIEDYYGDSWHSVDYSLMILDMLRGNADTGVPIRCSYGMDYPGSYIDADGNEIWESPLVTGSGYEFSSGIGDTVIVLLDPGYADAARTHIMWRLEPLEMIEELIGLATVSENLFD
jgi:hypothetical protein